MRNCPTCKVSMIRVHCGGPSQCDHGISLGIDCDECPPATWKCFQCGLEIKPQPSDRLNALIKAIELLDSRISVSVGPPGRIETVVSVRLEASDHFSDIFINHEALLDMSTDKLAKLILEEFYYSLRRAIPTEEVKKE